jgi:hypothetical protein
MHAFSQKHARLFRKCTASFPERMQDAPPRAMQQKRNSRASKISGMRNATQTDTGENFAKRKTFQ